MLLSRIDHDDRFGVSTHGRQGEELGRARHAANVADSTGQEYSNASSQPPASTTGHYGHAPRRVPGCPRTFLISNRAGAASSASVCPIPKLAVRVQNWLPPSTAARCRSILSASWAVITCAPSSTARSRWPLDQAVLSCGSMPCSRSRARSRSTSSASCWTRSARSGSAECPATHCSCRAALAASNSFSRLRRAAACS